MCIKTASPLAGARGCSSGTNYKQGSDGSWKSIIMIIIIVIVDVFVIAVISSCILIIIFYLFIDVLCVIV